jgi:hypothetical protein
VFGVLRGDLVSSRRRSSFSSGIGSMMMVPLSCGLMPSPLSRIAFSTLPTSDLSQTLMVTIRGSGTFTVPTWLIGVMLRRRRRPWTGSSICAEARPVRSEANSPPSALKAPSMRRSQVVEVDSKASSAILFLPIFSFCAGVLRGLPPVLIFQNWISRNRAAGGFSMTTV